MSALKHNIQVCLTIVALSGLTTSGAWSANSGKQQPPTPVRGTATMGVSSAWTGTENSTITARDTKIQQARSAQPAVEVRASKVVEAHASKNVFSEKTVEKQLDDWQKQFRNFVASSKPKVVAFSNWAAQRIGFGKRAPVPNIQNIPDLKIAGTTRSTIKAHLQPVSGTHSAWLLKDGRLKTVAAR